MEEQTFEAALAELEAIVTRLEEGELALDEAIALYEKGRTLAAYCAGRLDDAKMKVEQLAQTGEIVPVE